LKLIGPFFDSIKSRFGGTKKNRCTLFGISECPESILENIMAGYWQQPAESAKVLSREGLWTGDLARRDEDGFLYIVSRKSDIIKSGSHRIGPKEIEDTLAEHPAVHEIAVVGIADEILDERILACVVLVDGCECHERELIKHCRKELPAYKVPQEIRFFCELPKTATGKIKKTELKKA